MEQYFILMLVFLGILAAFDLFVGVSNDAVNFLNSAVGSRIAPYRIIMVVASLGVLIGATFSSGMMEIARSGVFNPEYFTFAEIMTIFFAVMITDVLLLDIFNSFGLPTSTTVSIIFELLGGAVAVASYKIIKSGAAWAANIGSYINNEKALAIISGIFISVIVAFVAGTIIQFLVRLVFSFKYGKIYKYVGSSFGGLAISSILYFLVMKGANGASFMKPEYIAWIDNHTWTILLTSFLGLTAIFQVLISLFNFNVFRIIILSGTFALAFAFAGNDLVNFVGVPLAALDSFQNFKASGAGADLFTMESLRHAVKTPTSLLLLAGLIMVATLWFSKKAQRVVQTSINLSSSSRGAKEQFGSSLAGRKIVRSTLKVNHLIAQIIPPSAMKFISSRMEQAPRQKGEVQLPFDQVRASINLILSSILIASATSLKLPLSTTYVTFMVAMGSSFADGAWDRESAVYRISGVMTVIGGWFFTAFTAFTICLLVAFSVIYNNHIAVAVWMILVIAMLIKSNFFPKKKKEDKLMQMEKVDRNLICTLVNNAVNDYYAKCVGIYKNGLNAFLNEDLKHLRKCKNESIALFDEISKRRGEYYRFAVEGSEDKVDRDAHYYYYRVYSNLKEISHNVRSTMGGAFNHIDNNHRVFKGILRDNLEKVIKELEELQAYTQAYTQGADNEDSEYIHRVEQTIFFINEIQKEMLGRIEEDDLSLRGSEMYLNLLQLGREMANRFSLMALLHHELRERCKTT